MRADNRDALIGAARRRSHDARRRTLAAVATLSATGAHVTPTSVARQAGVSRQWLYTFDDALEAIRAAARITLSSAVPSAERSSVASLQRRLEALTDDNQRLRKRVGELEERLAVLYGELRSCQ
jgi:hypothetical protein